MEALCVDANTDRNMRFAAQLARRLQVQIHTHTSWQLIQPKHWYHISKLRRQQTMDVLGLVTWNPLLQDFPHRRWPHSKATASSALNSAHRAAVKYKQVHCNHDNRYIGSHNDPHTMYAPTTVPRCLSLRLPNLKIYIGQLYLVPRLLCTQWTRLWSTRGDYKVM